MAGSTRTITTNASGDTITFASSGGGGTQNVFNTFAVSGQSNVVADSTTDTLTLVAGTGIGITTDASADSITIANTANLFSTIAVSGQSNVVADATSDTLTFVAGSGITITTDASADSVTITNSATGANAFGNILVSGQSTVAADSTNDNLTLWQVYNMTILQMLQTILLHLYLPVGVVLRICSQILRYLDKVQYKQMQLLILLLLKLDQE